MADCGEQSVTSAGTLLMGTLCADSSAMLEPLQLLAWQPLGRGRVWFGWKGWDATAARGTWLTAPSRGGRRTPVTTRRTLAWSARVCAVVYFDLRELQL